LNRYVGKQHRHGVMTGTELNAGTDEESGEQPSDRRIDVIGGVVHAADTT
jgi:hypothetical protein